METLDTTSVQPIPRADSGVSAPVSLRLAYLLSIYPAVSHTFFLNEVLGLRARGLHIETASINPPDRPLEALPAIEREEAANTFYLKNGRHASSALALLKTALTHAAALFRGLRAVAAIPALTLRQRAFWLFYLAEALLLGRWMQQKRLSHLHVHFGGAVAAVGMLASAAWRIPYSLTIHGPEELLNTDSYHLRQKIHAASFVFCISDFCRSQLCQLTTPDQWHKFSVIRLGVDPVTLTPTTRHATGTAELVSVGRMVPAKGHRILLEALRLLRERGLDFHLTLIGGGTDLAALQQFVSQHGLSDAVTFTGALSHAQTLAHVRRADIFTLASFAEGIPVALMEAMSLGVACVSTTIAGIPELIHSGSDGLLVPPANAPALAEAIESLIANPALRKSLGYAARQTIISHYNLPLNQELLAQSFAYRLAPEAKSAEERRRTQ